MTFTVSNNQNQWDLFIVSFQQGKSPLPDGKEEHSGCCFCDVVFKPLMEKHHAINRLPQRGRGRGRGRGGGRGRPRGRGRAKPKDKMAQLAAYFV